MSYGSQIAGTLGKWGQPYKDTSTTKTTVEEEGGMKGLLAALPEIIMNYYLTQLLGGGGRSEGLINQALPGGGTRSASDLGNVLGVDLGSLLGGGMKGDLLGANTMTPNILLSLLMGMKR